MPKKPLGLYLHIPFCKAKCAYCDFYSIPGAPEEQMQQYVNALADQMTDYAAAAAGYQVDTVFIGGGTPSLLTPSQMELLINTLSKQFSLAKKLEFTIEANPATVDHRSLSRFRSLGINRLSLGLQSAENAELAALSRIHQREDFEESFGAARDAGFDNINVDIMYGIPLQTADSFIRTLEYVTALSPEHISMYGLKIEEGTLFYQNRDTLLLPDEDTEAGMYFDGIRCMLAKNYHQYEISNFAKPGHECRHNLKYWNCDEYLGFGPAAHSYFGGLRFSYKRDLCAYIEAVNADLSAYSGNPNADRITYNELAAASLTDELYTLSPEERIGEYIMLRLRLTAGISSSEFMRRFGLSFDGLYGRRLQIYIDNGFMTYDGDAYAFTPKGMYVSNYILSNILDFDENSRLVGGIADGTDH